ncbi:hypothetical protein D046_5790B, partial [Vibrio parahaemolyticus V-223/04]
FQIIPGSWLIDLAKSTKVFDISSPNGP